MPEALLPHLLVACRLTLHGGPSPLLALLGAHHDPAFGALRQVLRRGRGLGDPTHPAHPRHGEPGHVLCAVEPTVGDVDAGLLPALLQLPRQGLHRLQQRPFVAGVAVTGLQEVRHPLPRRHQGQHPLLLPVGTGIPVGDRDHRRRARVLAVFLLLTGRVGARPFLRAPQRHVQGLRGLSPLRQVQRILAVHRERGRIGMQPPDLDPKRSPRP